MKFFSSLSRTEITVILITAVVFFLILTIRSKVEDKPIVSAQEIIEVQPIDFEIDESNNEEPIEEQIQKAAREEIVADYDDVDLQDDDSTQRSNALADAAIEGAPEPDYSIEQPTDLPPISPEDDVPPYDGADIKSRDDSEELVEDLVPNVIDNINELVMEGDPQASQPKASEVNLPEVAPEDDVPPRDY